MLYRQNEDLLAIPRASSGAILPNYLSSPSTEQPYRAGPKAGQTALKDTLKLGRLGVILKGPLGVLLGSALGPAP